MALTALLGVVACNTNTATEVNVVIGSAVTEIRAGDSVTLTATVTEGTNINSNRRGR